MRRQVILAVAIYVGLCMAGGAFLVDRTLQLARRVPITAADRARADDLARTLGARLETVAIAGADEATLRGWLLTPDRPNGSSVLLLHGIASNRAAPLDAVGMFVERGYRSLVVDLRAHGDSGGEFSTFGTLEADDTRRWIARLRSGAPDACVYAFGQSLGGDFALQAAAAPGLCALVSESGSASLRETAFDRIGHQVHAGSWVGRTVLRPGVEFGFLYTRMRYGLDLGSASAVASVARRGAPILLIHGVDDDNVPMRHAQMMQAANPSRVSLWLVPGAGHGGFRQAAPAEYRARIMNFLAMHRAVW